MNRAETDKVNGCRLTVTEYEVREIDSFGDALDVRHFPSKAEALTFAADLEKTAVAVVIEKHISRRPAHLFNTPDTYIAVSARGNRRALIEGGWL